MEKVNWHEEPESEPGREEPLGPQFFYPCLDESLSEEEREANCRRLGTEAAVRFLKRMGYLILERGWDNPAGEVDIICEHEGVLVFADVTTNASIERGLPMEFPLSAEERRRRELAAAYYLKGRWRGGDIQFRFDTVGINVIGGDRVVIRHHVNSGGIGV